MDVLNEIETSLLEDARSFVETLDIKTKLENNLTHVFAYIRDNQERFSLLVFRNGRDVFRQAYLKNIMNCLIPQLLSEYAHNDAYLYSYLTSGCFAIVFNWAKAGYKTLPKELSQIICKYSRKLLAPD